MRILLSCTKWLVSLISFGFICICGVYITSYLLGPPPLENNYTSVFLDSQGDAIEIGHTLGDEDLLDRVPTYLLDATMLTEDKNFYTHHGFDIKGIFRAITRNIIQLQLKEGASTITQQLARNLYLTHEKTWTRKLKEAWYTIRLEMFYTKEEILTGYMDTIYYGHGAYGIEAASLYFFNKQVSDVTIAEAAMLAGIPKGPTYYSPFNDEEKAFERQGLILKILLDAKRITLAEYHQAKGEELHFHTPETTNKFAGYYTDLVVREASNLLGRSRETIINGGYSIFTTLDPALQASLEATIVEKIAPDSEIEIGALALEPETGAIKALIGGNMHQESAFNRAIDAKRMVGSTFKPFVYYAALEHGFTPTTMLLSEPTTFKIDAQHVYAPKNYNGYYAYKPITLAQAIAVSDNIYAVKTNLFLDPKTVIDTAKDFGITSDLPNVASLALGSASISLNEMVTAYGMIANGGTKIQSYTIEKIVDRNGKTIYKNKQPQGKQVLDENKAFLLTHLMTGMFDERLSGNMHVTGASIKDQLHRVYAGKSGTTNSDSWMIGYSPIMVTGVWTGYDDNRALSNVADAAIAKQVWASFMEMAHENDRTAFTIPKDVSWRMIDPETGFIASDNCPVKKLTYFEKGTEPVYHCSIHHPNGETVPDKVPSQSGFFKNLWEIFQ